MITVYQRILTRFLNVLAHSHRPWVKHAFIFIVMRLYPNINLAEAEITEWRDYPSFNAFFTRALKVGARPLDTHPKTLVSPVDGVLVSSGAIEGDQILQVKGKRYALSTLLGPAHYSWAIKNGFSTTLYLRPDCYHRIHMPCTGRLQSMHFIPGHLYSVGPHNTQNRFGLFSQNERLVTLWETDYGRLAVVMVGAMLVSGMATVWHGLVDANTHQKPTSWSYDRHAVMLDKGDEMGCFHYGSTVILVLERAVDWQVSIAPKVFIQMGQALLCDLQPE